MTSAFSPLRPQFPLFSTFRKFPHLTLLPPSPLCFLAPLGPRLPVPVPVPVPVPTDQHIRSFSSYLEQSSTMADDAQVCRY